MSARGRSTSPRGRGARTPRHHSRDTTPDDTDRLVEVLCSSLGVPRPVLHKVSAGILDEAVAALGLPLPERARLSVALADLTPHAAQGVPAESALISYFAEKEKRANERWRATAAVVAQQRAAICGTSPADTQELFLDLAKCGAIGAEDALTLAYLLFGSAEDRLYYAGLLLTTSGLDRVKAHNFTTAAAREDPAFLSAYGPVLETFPWPLFPADKRFNALNQKLLAATSLSGGGPPDKRHTPPVFKDLGPQLFGGSFVPILGPDGVQIAAAEVSVLERGVAEVASMVSRLRNAAAAQTTTTAPRSRGARGRGGGQGRGRKDQVATAPPPSRNNRYYGAGPDPKNGDGAEEDP